MDAARRPPSTTRIPFDAQALVNRLLSTALLMVAVLFALDLVFNVFGSWVPSPFQRWANTGREDGFASWWGITQTFVIGLLGVACAVADRAAGAEARVVTGWRVIAGFFLYMAFDDGTMFHERVGTIFEDVTGGVGPSYGWQVVFVPIFGALGLYTAWFLFDRAGQLGARGPVILALGAFVLAVGLDFLEGLDPDDPGNPYYGVGRWAEGFAALTTYDDGFDLVSHLSRSVEECLEVFANTLLGGVVARYLVTTHPTIVLHHEPDEG